MTSVGACGHSAYLLFAVNVGLWDVPVVSAALRNASREGTCPAYSP